MARKSGNRRKYKRGGGNFGKKRPFTVEEVEHIREMLSHMDRLQELVLFRVAVDTFLRSCDLVTLKVCDVLRADPPASVEAVRDSFFVQQQKTKKTVLVGLSKGTRATIWLYLEQSELKRSNYLFPGRKRNKPMTTATFRKRVKSWARLAGLDDRFYSGHSTRRTRFRYIKEQTQDLNLLRVLLGQSSIEATIAYDDMDQVEALEKARGFEI